MAQAPYQNGLTIGTPVRVGHVEALSDVLTEFSEALPDHEDIPFNELTRVHFLRWVLLPATTDDHGRETTPTLLLSTNYDEPLDAHLNELYDVAEAALHRVYQHCEGYPDPANRSRERVTEYLWHHDIGYDTLYVGTRGRTVTQIRREAELRNRIQHFLDEKVRQEPSFRDQSPGAIRAAIQDFVQSTPCLAWAEDPPPPSPTRWPQPWDSHAAALLVVVLLLIPAAGWGLGAGWVVGGIELALLLVGTGAYLGWLRWRETHDPQDPPVTDYDHVAKLTRKEDRIVQNQMSSVTTVKAGRLRRATLYAVLWVIDLAGRYVYTSGKLGSISSIHFARWVVIDEGRRLVFFSNFDGSWENYLGDFIDKAASGLTAVWSHTVGFPRSRFLVGKGARDEQRFKAYARNSQVLTEVWYSAYRDLTVQNINNNAALRAGLFGDQTPEETRAWLQRL
jgi:hypothetical protein